MVSHLQKGWKLSWVYLAAILLFVPAKASSATVSPLFSRGYTVIPEPQKVSLGNKDFRFGDEWPLELAGGVSPADVAVESLKEGLESRSHVNLAAPGRQTVGAKVIRLRIALGSVTIGEALDRDKNVLAQEAYRMVLAPDSVSITANAAPGLFYGVETLVQLVKRKGNDLWLPEGEIVDWPDLQLREIYWDDAHHLDHLDVLKDAVRRAAFFKANAFSLKLEGHFQYKSAPALVEPYALSPAQLQELTDYALHYHVQLIPFVDAPGHTTFILKHPEYAKLRAFPENNYGLCTTNPDSYKLLFGMYEDLLDATKGAKYFHFGGDEAYFVGLAKNSQCDEATRAQELGSVGKVLAEFYTKIAGYLHDRGRTPMLWAYDPLAPGDLPWLPSYLVNMLTNGPKFDPVFKAHGIRQTLYLNTVWGDPFFFPRYFILPAAEHVHSVPLGEYEDVHVVPLVQAMYEYASFEPARGQADLIGVINTGWADEGLHPETFWLGYATGLGYAWHPGAPNPQEAMDSFFRLFYGPSAVNMARVYQLMSLQGQFWLESWDRTATNSRGPLFGSDMEIYKPPRPSAAVFDVDQSLPLLPVPSTGYLTLGFDWGKENAKRLELASKFLRDNDELLSLLEVNYRQVQFHSYNLEVFIAIAQLFRQNLLMLQNLSRVNEYLQLGQRAAFSGDAEGAVVDLDHALDLAETIRQQRNRALQDAVATWYKSYYPRVPEANGRRFVHELDNVKDHLADRTVDMGFLVNRELVLPLGEWAAQVQQVRNQYAQSHSLPARNGRLNWEDLRMTIPQ